MNPRYIISLILTALFLSGLHATTDLICGTGRGESFEQAFGEAQVQIAQQISVRVEAVSELKSLDIEAEGKAWYSQSIEKSTRLSVDQKLTGVTVVSQSEKDGIFEVKACLDKAKLVSSLKTELDALKSSALALVIGARSMAAAGKPLIAVKNYTDAQALLPELVAKKAIYDVFAPMSYPVPEELSISALESSLRDLISRISFRVASGGDQSAPSGSDLPQPVIFTALYKASDGPAVPIPGFPVRLSYGDDSPIEKGLTNADGNYVLRVKAHRLSGQNKVVIRSDATMLPAHLYRISAQALAEAFYQVEASQQVEVAVRVVDAQGQRLENVERAVAKALSGTNFVISESADLELNGFVVVDAVKMVEGLAAPSQVATVKLELQLKRRSSGRGLGTFSANGTGMSTKSEAEAIRDAIGKISINGRKLSAQLTEYLQAE